MLNEDGSFTTTKFIHRDSSTFRGLSYRDHESYHSLGSYRRTCETYQGSADWDELFILQLQLFEGLVVQYIDGTPIIYVHLFYFVIARYDSITMAL